MLFFLQEMVKNIVNTTKEKNISNLSLIRKVLIKVLYFFQASHSQIPCKIQQALKNVIKLLLHLQASVE
jgi:hypothetical protein